MSALKVLSEGISETKSGAISEAVSVSELAKDVGFPLEFLKKELLITDSETSADFIELEELRKRVLSYLSGFSDDSFVV